MRVAQAFLKQWLTHTTQCRFAPVLRPSASAPPVTFVDGCSVACFFLRYVASLLESPELVDVVCCVGHFSEPLYERPYYGIWVTGGRWWYVGLSGLSTISFRSRFHLAPSPHYFVIIYLVCCKGHHRQLRWFGCSRCWRSCSGTSVGTRPSRSAGAHQQAVL